MITPYMGVFPSLGFSSQAPIFSLICVIYFLLPFLENSQEGNLKFELCKPGKWPTNFHMLTEGNIYMDLSRFSGPHLWLIS